MATGYEVEYKHVAYGYRWTFRGGQLVLSEPITENNVKALEPPKLCINCEHIGTNSARDAEKYRCFAPENECGVDLVTGEKQLRWDTCYIARESLNAACGPEGKWFKPAPLKELKAPEKIVRRPVDTSSLFNELDNL